MTVVTPSITSPATPLISVYMPTYNRSSMMQRAIASVLAQDYPHFELLIVSEAFNTLPRVRRHQAVYAALGDAMRDELVHALTMQTLTPEEWANRG